MSWAIDTSHSTLEFSAKHMMITTVRGRFQNYTVDLNLNEQDPTQSSVAVTVDVASLTTGDARRDAHLKSADFFDVETYPNLTFHSTNVAPAGEGKYKVTGDLTIKDMTHPVTLNVVEEGRGKDPWGGQRWAFSLETSINRKDWNLNWNVALETGGWLVGDTIKISADVQTVSRVEEPAQVA